MKIALFHNYYKLRGGEDVMFELECEALRSSGHEVVSYSISNREQIKNESAFLKAKVAWRAVHNHESAAQINAFLAKHRPDISHAHNWFPILSPAIYDEHARFKIPVVQTLHNYRLGCASANYRRNGGDCQLCRPGNNLAAIRNRCYRNSLLGTLAWKRTVDRGWSQGTFLNKVSHYISPSQEIMHRHIQMGIPAQRISIIPNACKDPYESTNQDQCSLSACDVAFLGRLVPEKGVDVLLRAFRNISMATVSADHATPSLRIIGDGPERHALEQLASTVRNVEFTGQLEQSAAHAILKQSKVLVFPSRWAEPFGLGIIEAMACGLPVIAADLGGPSEIVEHGVDGLLVPPDDPVALEKAIHLCLSNPALRKKMGQAAREKFKRLYTPDSHAQQLTALFKRILGSLP